MEPPRGEERRGDDRTQEEKRRGLADPAGRTG
jgi:hypothetical protein